MPDFRTVAAEAQLPELEATSAAVELVEAGLWLGRLPGPGYELKDFLKWNLDAAEIKSRAAENLARVQAYRKKGFPDPSKESEHIESKNTQNTQVRTGVRNALHEADEPTLHLQPDGLYTPSPADIKRGKEAAQRLLEIKEEKLDHRPVGLAS